jgi:hypothetical protein
VSASVHRGRPGGQRPGSRVQGRALVRPSARAAWCRPTRAVRPERGARRYDPADIADSGPVAHEDDHRRDGGIDVYTDPARFVGPRTVRVGDETIAADRIVVAAVGRHAD